MNTTTDTLRLTLRENMLTDESSLIRALAKECNLSQNERENICQQAVALVNKVRTDTSPALMESFLTQFGLSTDEGIALMCLAEALLRVPDSDTVDALIHDKIAPADWGKHLGQSSSSMVNASTWALLLTGSIIADEPDGIAGTLRALVKRAGEPIIRTAVNQAIRELGNQFVLGESILDAIKNAQSELNKGFTYSYDMLGEAALTEADAKRYHLSYSRAISELGKHCEHDTVAANPGISVKLSALFSRYEYAQKERVMIELVARTRSLAMLAKSGNMGFNIDAEEADRLDLSLDVIEAVLSEPSLAGWDGFGIVVQAYSRRASFVIDWIYDLAKRLDRKLMVRLVKGAYWDTEIKLAQVNGLESFPVYTLKNNTDVSYIACAKKLLTMSDRIYPQFATHNAHTVAAILELAGSDKNSYEFQRLHGMGESLHDIVKTDFQTRCRIYAPVGAHEDLLAYLVRRLLENGANSSFVNQLVDESVPAEEIAGDPFKELEQAQTLSHPAIKNPADLFLPAHINSRGFDVTDPLQIAELDKQRSEFDIKQWHAGPMPGQVTSDDPASKLAASNETGLQIPNPANSNDIVGYWHSSTVEDVERAFQDANAAYPDWSNKTPQQRADLLLKVADLYETNSAELITLTCREAGKTLQDSIAEIREAVDFLRYYAHESISLMQQPGVQGRGSFVCISPWNFPLAIFTGQIAAALAAGNCVLAKPADQTPLIAARAVALFIEAGIDQTVLQLLPGTGAEIGASLTSHPKLDGVCFTGSTATARLINSSMARHAAPDAPLIAETGGLNAMIVDSTALPEQAVKDIVESAFQSTGQRCSALRMLYVQADIFERIQTMLLGAMEELVIGDPRHLKTDVGPVIDKPALSVISAHCESMINRGRLLAQTPLPADLPVDGSFFPPTLLKVEGIHELESEIFGPVLHIASFESEDLFSVIDSINKAGYGLTFGLHTRVDERVQEVLENVDAGNLYINRNQIGAVVGSQPFGGRNLSGTGPKAGGPHYLLRFIKTESPLPADDTPTTHTTTVTQNVVQEAIEQLQAPPKTQAKTINVTPLQQIRDALAEPGQLDSIALSAIELPDAKAFHQMLLRQTQFILQHHHDTLDLPGPTGESNRLSMHPTGVQLCFDHGNNPLWIAQILACLMLDNPVVAIAPNASNRCEALASALLGNSPRSLIKIDGRLDAGMLSSLQGIAGVAAYGPGEVLREMRQALALREGAIVPLLTDPFDISPLVAEKTLCINTTAAGGNASLLAQTS